MTKDTLNDLPDGRYNASDIIKSIQTLPPDLQQVVAEGLKTASQERKKGQDILQLQLSLAEFATALHLIVKNENNKKSVADLITWGRLTYDIAESVIECYKPELKDTLPDSAQKAIAYCFAINSFARDISREEVDEALEPFGYPISRIIDDLMADFIQRRGGDDSSSVNIRNQYEEGIEGIDLWDDLPKLEQEMRIQLLSLGYKLPDLDHDMSYGHSNEEGDHYPKITSEMLPH